MNRGKVGYYGVIHQGWRDAKNRRAENPYPEGSSAWADYALGVRRFDGGVKWDGDKKAVKASP